MLFSPFSAPNISFPNPPSSICTHFLMSGGLPTGSWGALIRAVSFTLSLSLLSFSPVARLWYAPSPFGSLALSWSSPYSPLVQSRFCLDWLVPISQANSLCAAYLLPWWWRQQAPWNVGKLQPDYTALQPRRQSSSFSSSCFIKNYSQKRKSLCNYCTLELGL
jgi:hypothetical protein